ncbi:MAG TPA: energy transducer TonB [Sphingomicrobium sp.]
MPASVENNEEARAVGYEVTVRPDGTVRDCTVTAQSGLPKLDQITCTSMMRRARFKPAKWSDGSAVFGVYRSSAVWGVEGASVALPADAKLSVKALPSDVRGSAIADIAFEAASDGRVAHCIRVGTASDVRLVAAACDWLLASYKAVPVLDAGKQVRSVQTLSIVFAKD